MEIRKQVSSELKLRRYVMNTLLALSLIYVFGTLVFSDMGILKYMEIKQKHDTLAMELTQLEDKNRNLDRSLKDYSTDNYFLEKYARENFGMSKSDELIFIYKD